MDLAEPYIIGNGKNSESIKIRIETILKLDV